MRLRLCTSLILTVLLAACSSAPPAADTAPAAATSPEAAEAYREARDVDCQAAGGTLQRLGRLQRVQCVIPYADAGKTCSRKSDCTGQCLASGEVAAGSAATGTCQRDVRQNFGCRQRIDDGKAQGTICVD
ncbi:hypothetical protein N5C16_11720 [Stenotrophomonas sp. GD03908]|uniref:Secreted protein n=1 Tax=Stenotrophomonas maltophilia TaxID=40324 RepID=A0AAJ2TMV6_STEMA|nr:MULTISPECIES: hypothetical protein [Stenotrophomonas]MBH1482085.1 hypothetical protein [Stenotrophomonas maltophilia]MCU1064634.1 hypothetical protein [Stenotrophomonas maltophilia]MDH0979938.1 hypothetical protein [Stenotrophomonas sp. GD03908]MDQ7293882.1 hypothetical protein [Stenotrophomonas sp. Sm0041]MDZ5765215.1 hypothetical protein [Stenotrophomonas maltophilia]